MPPNDQHTHDDRAVVALESIRDTNKQMSDDIRYLAKSITEIKVDQATMRVDVDSLKQFRNDTIEAEKAAEKATGDHRVTVLAAVLGGLAGACLGLLKWVGTAVAAIIKGNLPPPSHPH